MFCKVSCEGINSTIFETIGNQIVCGLSWVALLQSYNECQIHIWIDNYYKIDSLFYCSERWKKKPLKII